MTADREIDYEALAQNAMRGIVRTVLSRVAKSGLPGEHHFYIAFKTDVPGVVLSNRLREKYPEEMTVVLQHRFWDLIVTDDRFEVNLTFDSIPERLVVPFSAIKVFFDPSVPYGLQFDEAEAENAAAQQVAAPRGDAQRPAQRDAPAEKGSEQVRGEKRPRAAARRAPAERSAGADKPAAKPLPLAKPADPAASTGPKVVSIDAFRKK
jgi:hypothetical protein